MELRQYMAIIKRRKWIIVLTTIVTTLLAAFLTFLSTPQYISETTLRVATVTNIDYTQILMNTYAQIATSDTVRGELSDRLGLGGLPVVSVDLVPNTELMIITVEAPDPNQAQAIANEAASILTAQSREIYSGSGQTTTEILAAQVAQAERELNEARAQYEELLAANSDDEASLDGIIQTISLRERTYSTLLDQYETARVNEALLANSVSVVEPASLPLFPSKPRTVLNLILGVLSGLALGTVLAFVVDNLDTRLYTQEQMESATQFPVIGRIPSAEDDLKIARLNNGHYPQLEAFRRLRTNVVSAEIQDSDQVTLLTSARRGEGKSTVCANLGVALSQSGRRAIIVDCDMRLPTIHKFFNLPNKRGLTNVLTKEVSLDEAVLDSSFPRLHILTSGVLPPNPTELLGSQQMVTLVEQLRQKYDYILLDTPALLSVADAAVLLPVADKTVLVVSLAQTRRDDIATVRRQLSNINEESIEVVINRAGDRDDYVAYGPDSEMAS